MLAVSTHPAAFCHVHMLDRNLAIDEIRKLWINKVFSSLNLHALNIFIMYSSIQMHCGIIHDLIVTLTVQKFVCTTLRPTLLAFKELYHWNGCAEFVADYITMEQLDPPVELPKYLYSPSTILRKQTGWILWLSSAVDRGYTEQHQHCY